MRSTFALGALILSALSFAACSGSSNGSGFDSTNDPTGKNGNGKDGGGGGDLGGPTGDAGSFGKVGEAGGGQGGCTPDPSFYDIPGDNCDNDGDGKVDNVVACDQGLAATGDANDFAKALGLCQTADASGKKWGVISATFTNGHVSASPPNDAQHGILPKFGNVVTPREGGSLGVISSGSASETDSDMGPAFKGTKNGMQSAQGGDAPTGYPKASPACGSASQINNSVNDVVNVKLQIRVPANAKGLSFDFDFWSGEWPEFVCTSFNDSFIAFLSSKAFNNGTADNMSFDSKNNPVSVNNGFFDRCTPNTQTGCAGSIFGVGGTTATAACPGGVAELAGTGFEDIGKYCKTQSTGGGATGWLTSTAPVQPGETITLEFMIWDTGDASYDSSVLLDNFQWVPNPVSTGTVRPPPK